MTSKTNIARMKSVAKAKLKGFDTLEKLTPILLVMTIGLAFVVGMLWQKVSLLEGGGVKVTSTNEAPPPVNGKLSDAEKEKLPEKKSEDHVRGSKDAQITLIEYSDFECPFCARFHPTAKKALEVYGDKIAWVYRHFPLENIHARAYPAANAAECVADIGGEDAFWEFSDYLFENQGPTTLSDSGLAEAAGLVGIEANAFGDCYRNSKFNDKVAADYKEGLEAGVTGTPGNFIINAEGEVWVVPGAVPFDEEDPNYGPGATTLKSVIEEALAN